jgi:hypothetical protein
LLQDLQDRLDLEGHRLCRIKGHLHVTGNAWPGVPRSNSSTWPCPSSPRISTHNVGCASMAACFCYCVCTHDASSGSSRVDQREVGHQQRQHGHGSTEGHAVFRLDVSDDASDDLHGSNSPHASAACRAFPAVVLHAAPAWAAEIRSSESDHVRLLVPGGACSASVEVEAAIGAPSGAPHRGQYSVAVDKASHFREGVPCLIERPAGAFGALTSCLVSDLRPEDPSHPLPHVPEQSRALRRATR